jgi:hypothetical protein
MGLGLKIEEAIIYSEVYYHNLPHWYVPTKSTYVIEVKISMWCQQVHLLQVMLTTSTHTAMLDVLNMCWTF